jgi:hypothetical protein
MVHMGMVCEQPVIHLPVCIHSMVLSLAQAVEGFRGAGAVEKSLVAGEGFVDGSSKE